MVCNSSPFLLFSNSTNNIERIKYMAERIEMLKTISAKKGKCWGFRAICCIFVGSKCGR